MLKAGAFNTNYRQSIVSLARFYSITFMREKKNLNNNFYQNLI